MEWLYEESSQCLAATLLQTYRTGAQREWPLLFQRTIKKSILDERQRTAQSRHWLWLIIGYRSTPHAIDSDIAGDERSDDHPASLLPATADLAVLLRVIERLPSRRQEIFLLRAWEGMNETEIAALLRCSEGSVRNHYRRALRILRTAWERRPRELL